MDNTISTRVISFMKGQRYSQVHFAEVCGINYQNFNKCVKGKKPWTDRIILKIADAFNLNYKWLRDGVGEMFVDTYHRHVAEGDEQFASTQEYMSNVRDISHVVNTINGNHNMGTQTIQASNDEVEVLKQKVSALEAALAEKDKTIELLKELIKNK